VIAFLDLRRILSYRFLTKVHNRTRRKTLELLEKIDRLYQPLAFLKPLCAKIPVERVDLLVQAVNVLDCVMLAMNLHVLPVTRLGVPSTIQFDKFFHLFYACEFIFRLGLSGGKSASVMENVGRHHMVFMAGLAMRTVLMATNAAPPSTLYVLTLLSRLMRCWRLMELNEDLKIYSTVRIACLRS
jgi:hypothetical protein